MSLSMFGHDTILRPKAFIFTIPGCDDTYMEFLQQLSLQSEKDLPNPFFLGLVANLDEQSAFACDLPHLYSMVYWYADKDMAHLCIPTAAIVNTAALGLKIDT